MGKSGSSEIKKNESENKPLEIPINGSLGLLALGAVGLKAWRKKRMEEQSKQKGSDSNE